MQATRIEPSTICGVWLYSNESFPREYCYQATALTELLSTFDDLDSNRDTIAVKTFKKGQIQYEPVDKFYLYANGSIDFFYKRPEGSHWTTKRGTAARNDVIKKLYSLDNSEIRLNGTVYRKEALFEHGYTLLRERPPFGFNFLYGRTLLIQLEN